MRVDLVDRGRRATPRDPIRPLAVALADAGHQVRLFSAVPPDPAPTNLAVVRLAVADVDGPRGVPALAKALGALTDPNAAALILPFELAGLKGAPSHRVLTVLPPGDAPPLERSAGGFLERLFGRRSARKEEALAIARSVAILAPGDEERERFGRSALAGAARTLVVPPPVPLPPELPDRSAARRALHLPDDVPVATVLGVGDDAAAVALARAAFQRARVFFPGARLMLPGATAPSEPGAHPLPGADAATRRAAARAADVLIAPSLRDPVELLTYVRTGIPALVGRSARLPIEPAPKLLRRPEADDAGALASDLAELLADPALRRSLGESGRSYADAYDPARLLATVLGRVGAA